MQFLVFGKPQEGLIGDPPPPEARDAMMAEFAKSREYYSKGHLRNIWLVEGNKGAVCLFEADSREEVQKLVDGYPMQQKGLVKHEIYPLEPYRGFQQPD